MPPSRLWPLPLRWPASSGSAQAVLDGCGPCTTGARCFAFAPACLAAGWSRSCRLSSLAAPLQGP
eukprot:12073278-Alexandrium_andersonii.AAC.1